MKTRNLGAGLGATSAIGLGCMGMSEFYGPTDRDQSYETLDRALELGVTFYDTADRFCRKLSTFQARVICQRCQRVGERRLA